MRAGSSSRLLAAAGLVILLTAACSPGATPQPTPTPTPVVASPPETAQEREQRVAYAAAEKSYRTFQSEYRRILRGGGAAAATPTMRATATGDYLKVYTSVIQAYKTTNTREVGREIVGKVTGQGYSPHSLILHSCEDDRPIDALDGEGNKVGAGEVRLVSITVIKVGLVWKMSSEIAERGTTCVS